MGLEAFRSLLVCDDSVASSIDRFFDRRVPLEVPQENPSYGRTRWSSVTVVARDQVDFARLSHASWSFGWSDTFEFEVRGPLPDGVLAAPAAVEGRPVRSVALERTLASHRISLRLETPVATQMALWSCLHGSRAAATLSTVHGRLAYAPELGPEWAGLEPGGYAYAQGFEDDEIDFSARVALKKTRFGGYVTAAHVVSDDKRDREIMVHTTEAVPPVDGALLNPMGFLVMAPGKPAIVRRDADAGLLLVPDGDESPSPLPHPGMTGAVAQAIRDLPFLREAAGAFARGLERAQFLVNAAAAGVPVVPAELDEDTRALLPPKLADLCDASTEEVFSDPFTREAHMLDSHRAVHGALARHRVLPSLDTVGHVFPGGRREPAVSCQVATRRPACVRNAAEQVLKQSWPHKELVVGLHGFGLADVPADVRSLLHECGAKVREFAGDTVYGDLMNGLTEMSDGQLIAKIDDDDWYGPHHLTDSVYQLEYSRASLTGAMRRFVYIAELDVTASVASDDAYHYSARNIGGGSMVMDAGFLESLGGWPRIFRGLDTEVLRLARYTGELVYTGTAVNYIYNRHGVGHTWTVDPTILLKDMEWTGAGLRPAPGMTQADVRPIEM